MNEPMTTKSPDLYAQLAYRMRESLGEFSDPNKGLETLVRDLAAFKRAHLAKPAQAVIGYEDRPYTRVHAERAIPRINIECETASNGITGTTSLNVIRVEPEDDGSFTAVTDHWPNAERATVPDGWVLVPREPTDEMWEAAAARVGRNRIVDEHGVLIRDPLAHAFLAFIAAAPSQPEDAA